MKLTVQVSDFVLNSEQRAQDRHEFDERQKQKEQEQQVQISQHLLCSHLKEQLRMRSEEKKRQEETEIALLRKMTVHKAAGVRHFK